KYRTRVAEIWISSLHGGPAGSSNLPPHLSTIAVRHGTSSSISLGASCPSDCANGPTGSDQWDLVLVGFLSAGLGENNYVITIKPSALDRFERVIDNITHGRMNRANIQTKQLIFDV